MKAYLPLTSYRTGLVNRTGYQHLARIVRSTWTEGKTTPSVASSILANQLYVAERYSRGHQLCSHSTVSKHFVECDRSLPLSQQTTCPHPVAGQSSPHHPHSIYTRSI
jgi:hypothetical protein